MFSPKLRRTIRGHLRRSVRALRGLHGRWPRTRVLRYLALALAAPVLLVGVVALFTPLPAELRDPAAPSLRVLARDGRVLREVRTDDGARAHPLPLASFPPHVRNAVLAAEDRRFYSHYGVDVVAVIRAAIANATHLRIVSGASTITMQLARTLRPHRRSAWGKVTEAALAIRIEAALSKDEILEAYLNRVTYGPGLRGYATASQAYFGTTPESLSLAQAALIAGLPRGPSFYAVTKHPERARRRRDRVLTRMAEASMIDDDAKGRAALEPIAASIDKPSFGAPHFVRGLVSGKLAAWQPSLETALVDRAELSEIRTTIDRDVQRAAEGAVSSTIASLTDKHVTAASVIVVENETGDVLAYVGSPDFENAVALGQNDGVTALRQPGSALKPFVYAEAMVRLGYTGATMLPDVEIHIPLPNGGDYVPHDYDTKLRGPVRLREALGNSLNVPAVATIHALGTQRVLDRLHAFGFESLTEEAEHYGPALALGDGEVTLIELANAYAALARGGEKRSVRLVKSLVRRGEATAFEPAPATRVLDERFAALVTDILSDKTARMSAFGDQNVLELEYDVAAKTGTSKGFRDNVAVGYTREITVAVWSGNFDGSPMADVSGITGAGPIFRSVMSAAMASRSPSTRRSLSVREDAQRLGLARTHVCTLTGELPTTACPHRVEEWLPAADVDHAPTCQVHEPVRVDVRNGLRAGPGCASTDTTTKIFERWAPPYVTWAENAHRPLVPDVSSPACPVEVSAPNPLVDDGRPRITYPFDGARFVIDPDRPTDLQLLDVRVEPQGAPIDVRVDGAVLRDHRWQLAPGEHVITAHRGAVESTRVRITVH